MDWTALSDGNVPEKSSGAKRKGTRPAQGKQAEGERKMKSWLLAMLDFKDAVCNLEIGLIEREPIENIERFILRVQKRWTVLKTQIEKELHSTLGADL
jgi:hypothetical protein